MRNKLILTAAVSIFAVPAMAQVSADVGATTEAGVGVEAPVAPDAAGAVQDTVDSATGTVQDTVDSATDAAAGTQVEAATAADVTAGAQVRDPEGNPVGTIESVDASGAVIATGESRVQIPVTSFGKDSEGLVIAMSKAELDAAAKAAGDPS